MGERDVSVNMDEIRIVTEEGDMGDRFLVVTTSKEMLEQAPVSNVWTTTRTWTKKRKWTLTPT